MAITPLMPVYPRCEFRPVRGEGQPAQDVEQGQRVRPTGDADDQRSRPRNSGSFRRIPKNRRRASATQP